MAEGEAVSGGISAEIRDTLISVGVLDADFSAWDQPATRGFAAYTVMRMLGLDTEALTAQGDFVDVDETTQYGGSITAAYQMGYIAPYDDGYFYPENPISYAELSKMLVSALGYDRVAAQSGGYPDGYTTLARGFGILKAADVNQAVSNAALYEMIYQAMDTNILEIGDITGNGVDFEEGNTLLNQYHDAILIQGVVTEAAGTAIDFREPVTKNNEMAVGEYILQTNLDDPQKYLGKKISAYIAEDEEGSLYGTLLSVTKVEQAVEYEIYDEDMTVRENAGGSRIFTFQTEGSQRNKNVTVPAEAMYYYNGRIVTDVSVITDTLQDLYEGYVRIVQADSGWYVFINEYYNIVVSGVNKAASSIKDAYTGEKISFEEYQDNLYAFQRFYSEGVQIPFEDIKAGSVVSVFESLERDYVVAYVGTESISGAVASYNEEDGYTVDGVQYQLARNIQKALENGQTDYPEIKLNDNVVFVLDFLGRVADLSIVRSDFTYSYLFSCNAMTDGDMGDEYLYRFKLWNPASGEAENFFAKEKIKVNGVTMKSPEEIQAHFDAYESQWEKLSSLVRVKFGEDNTISAIETPIQGTTDPDRLEYVYSGFTRVLSGRIEGKYLINNDTKVFEVSDTYEEVEPRTYSYINDYKNRDYILYASDELGFIDAIVIPNDAGAVTAKNEAIYYGDPIYMVKDASAGIISEDDDVGMIVTVADGGKDLELKESADGAVNVDQDINNTHQNTNYNIPLKDGKQYGTWGYGYLTFDQLQKGDLIQIDYDGKGGVNRFRVLARLGSIDGYFDISYLGLAAEPYSMLTYGKIDYMNKVGFKLNYTKDSRVYLNNTSAVVYIYNRTKQTLEVGAWNDVSNNAEVVIVAVKFGIKQVYVIEE